MKFKVGEFIMELGKAVQMMRGGGGCVRPGGGV